MGECISCVPVPMKLTSLPPPIPDCNGVTLLAMPKSKHFDEDLDQNLSISKKLCRSPAKVKPHSILSSPPPDLLPSLFKRKSVKTKKSVTFNESNLEQVIEFEDDQESKNTRKLYWEFVAVDRYRFKDRINRLESVLSPVLTESHRNLISARQHQKIQGANLLAPPLPPTFFNHGYTVAMEVVEVETYVEKCVVRANSEEKAANLTVLQHQI